VEEEEEEGVRAFIWIIYWSSALKKTTGAGNFFFLPCERERERKENYK
jgi:hypothetical protein